MNLDRLNALLGTVFIREGHGIDAHGNVGFGVIVYFHPTIAADKMCFPYPDDGNWRNWWKQMYQCARTVRYA